MEPKKQVDNDSGPRVKTETAPDHQVHGWYTLRMKRFRCYNNFELTIPSNGIVLLDGKNGIGKSTIFDAISFALYDNAGNSCYPRKDRNSKKRSESTTVELVFPDQLIVYRQRRPNLLRVKNDKIDLIDEVAQAYINQVYGSYNSWLAGGYLEQNQICSFFSMSAAEKLEFLQVLSASSRQGYTSPEELEEKLSRVAQKYSMLTQQLAQIEFQMKVGYEMYMRLGSQMPAEYRQFALWSEVQLSEKLSQYSCSTLVELLSKVKQRGQNDIQEIQAKITDVTAQMAKAKEQQEQKDRLEGTRDKVTAQLASLRSTTDLSRMQSELVELQEQMKSERRTQLLAIKGELQKKLDQIPSGSSVYTLSELDSFERILSGSPTDEMIKELRKLEHARLYYLRFAMYQTRESKRQTVVELKERLSAFPEKSCQGEIDEVTKQIWLIGLQDRKLTCPKCKSGLHLTGNALVELHDCLPATQLNELTIKKQRLQQEEDKYRQRAQLVQQVALAQSSYEQTAHICEKDLQGFDPNDKPGIIAGIPQLEFLIRQAKETLIAREKVPKINFEDERTKIYTGQEKNRLIRDLQGVELELDSLPPGDQRPVEAGVLERKNKLEIQIMELKTVEVTRVSLTGMVNQIISQIESLVPIVVDPEVPEKLKEQLNKVVSQTQWLQMEIQAQSYFMDMILIQKRYEQGQKDHQNIVSNIGRFHKIKQCLITAEYIVLDEILSEINETIADVLEHLFTEQTSVTLRSMKQLKSDERKKPEINCEIVSDGVECGNIKEMSGGERSRICLAMVIAFSHFSQIPFVFLDEALSPLDVISKESAISTIKKFLNNKLVITVNHDTTKGVYDSVISLQ